MPYSDGSNSILFVVETEKDVDVLINMLTPDNIEGSYTIKVLNKPEIETGKE